MAEKVKSIYVCTECGAESPKWYGKCPSCGEWNSLQEELRQSVSKPTASATPRATVQQLKNMQTGEEYRTDTGMKELDRVLGGGIVKGGLMLIGGDPGIGKSTLLLQICQHLGEKMRILYVSGEESEKQIKLRADRLGVTTDNLYLLCETDVDTVIGTVETEKPDLLIIDSIQTMSLSAISSSPGSVTQVRESTSAIMHAVKSRDLPTFIVGHVNKDGAIAGPKVMEHIVDCVLYFEGDTNSSYRILRCIKNRYGSTNEIGVFEMSDEGLKEVENPSGLMLSGRMENVSGTCVVSTMEGTRPILAEVQGLVSPSGLTNPRRMATGFDNYRLSLLLAVLEKRAGYFLSTLDTYVNVVGGLRLNEPAADLAVAIALITSLKDTAADSHTLAFGEIGLEGEIRAVNNAEARISEAVRLGFNRVILPAANAKKTKPIDGVEIIGVTTIREAYEAAVNEI
ncbi:MAG: DNA repair protein RadA [Clostridia bacterium]|nr:DNA repair protein RadA [Clostridia bacterium]